jgi:hypothetical protein
MVGHISRPFETSVGDTREKMGDEKIVLHEAVISSSDLGEEPQKISLMKRFPPGPSPKN